MDGLTHLILTFLIEIQFLIIFAPDLIITPFNLLPLTMDIHMKVAVQFNDRFDVFLGHLESGF